MLYREVISLRDSGIQIVGFVLTLEQSMASWITHLIIADSVLERILQINRHGFCVGNIAPDCNVENEDWTAFTPPREVTHWMQGERKKASDCDAFCEQ